MTSAAWSNADSWLDILDHVWIGIVLISCAAVPVWLNRKLSRIRGRTEEIGDQVDEIHGQVHGGNGHKLVNEVDGIKSDVRRLADAQEATTSNVSRLHDAQERTAAKLDDLHVDHVAERKARRLEMSELREDVDSRLAELHRRIV